MPARDAVSARGARVTWDPGPRPEWVRDAIDGRFDAVLARARDPFDRDALLDEARITTGLDDFGDDPFVEALDVLLASAEDESQLHVVGRTSRDRKSTRLNSSHMSISYAVFCLKKKKKKKKNNINKKKN